jgi:enamine deaminase RidA (YjgF/YER057c/UK114 family)
VKAAANWSSRLPWVPVRHGQWRWQWRLFLRIITACVGSAVSASRAAAAAWCKTIGMAPQLVRSPRLFSGTPYAYAAIVPNTGLIITAGACPLDDQGRVVAPGDIALQTRKALDNLRIALEDSGAAMCDVLKTTIFVSSSSRDDLNVAWNEVAGGFGDYDPPSTLLGVTTLRYPDQLVEIEAIAIATAP